MPRLDTRDTMLRAAFILILCLFVAGCHKPRGREAGPPLPLRLAYATIHDCALVQIAIARGFFRDEGLDVEAQRYGYGKAALQAVLAGTADVATVAETPFMLAALQGRKISLVSSIFTSNKNHSIVANRKSGVTAPGDLKGRRVGYTPGTTSHIFLSSFLAAHGLSLDDLTPTPLAPEQMQDALISRGVDAVAIRSPSQTIIADKLAKDSVIFHDPDIYTESFVIAGMTAYLDRNQEAMRRLLRALIRAEGFAASHPVEARALVAAYASLDPAVLAECWKESARTVSLDHALLIALEDETRWAMGRRLAPGAAMPNFLDHLDPRPLLSVKAQAVDPQVLK